MAKPSTMQKPNTQRVITVEEFDQLIKEEYKEQKTKKVISQIDANIKLTGKYSSREYLFPKAGSVQDVNTEDVEWILSLRQGERQCCGGSGGGNAVFRLVEN